MERLDHNATCSIEMFSLVIAFQMTLMGKVHCCTTLEFAINWYKDWLPTHKQPLIVLDGALGQGGGVGK